MRSLEDIDKDIAQCQGQIDAVYRSKQFGTEDSLITIEGFRVQLEKLFNEKEKTQAMHNMEVINPRLVRG